MTGGPYPGIYPPGRRPVDPKVSARADAREAEQVFRDALTAGRPEMGSAKIKAPPEREKVAKRFGGGTRARSGEYDWFYELNPAEQSRIRRNWMSHDRTALTPDEVEEMGLPMHQWLALTRGIDAARAVQTGRYLQPKRYGGRNPLHYLAAGRPDDHGETVRHFQSRRGTLHEVPAGARVQFFTDADGIVHPIRATYENHDTPPARPKTYLNAYGERVEYRRPTFDPDEDF
jgi:hypothetical protein